MYQPSFHALRVFESVARHGQLAAAAAELNVTAGAISQQLRSLQDNLGFRLFTKAGRHLVLNDQGIMLQRTVRDAMDSIRDKVRDLASHEESALRPSVLTVFVPPLFGMSWLTPRIFAFLQNHPHIRLKVHTSIHFSAIDWRMADVAINLGNPPWPGFWSKMLHNMVLRPVCGPQLLRGPLAIRSLLDLLKHRLLHEDDGEEWRRYLALAGLPSAGDADIYLSSYAMVLRAAQDGHGVALVDEFLVSQELDSGRLVQPLRLSMPATNNYHCICREESLQNKPVRQFIDWLSER